jgi:enoyl-CoA hydratase/carnithine racemase
MSGADSAIRISVPPDLDPASGAAFLKRVNVANGIEGRVIVLEGADGVFCRGLDPKCVGSGQSLTKDDDLQVFADALLALRRISKAVIAAVDGIALGGGLGLAAAADVVVATEESTFGLPEAQLGLAPAIIMPFLVERMRLQECRLWALSSYSRSAAEAARAGLVDVLTTRADFQRQTQYWIRQMSRAHPTSVYHVKRLTSAGGEHLESSIRGGLALTSELLRNLAAFKQHE